MAIILILSYLIVYLIWIKFKNYENSGDEANLINPSLRGNVLLIFTRFITLGLLKILSFYPNTIKGLVQVTGQVIL